MTRKRQGLMLKTQQQEKNARQNEQQRSKKGWRRRRGGDGGHQGFLSSCSELHQDGGDSPTTSSKDSPSKPDAEMQRSRSRQTRGQVTEGLYASP